jgi:hypothetical protein
LLFKTRLVFEKYQSAQYLILFVQVLVFTAKVIDGCRGLPGSIFSRISNEEEYFNILSSGLELYVT